jgi:hypothetical protein
MEGTTDSIFIRNKDNKDYPLPELVARTLFLNAKQCSAPMGTTQYDSPFQKWRRKIGRKKTPNAPGCV